MELVNIPPEKIEAIENDTKLILEEGSTLQIVDAERYQAASAFLIKVKQRLKRLEEMRTEITVPINTALKAVNNRFKMFSEPLENIEKLVKKGLAGYVSMIEEEAKKLAEIPSSVPVEMPKITVRTEGGLMHTKKVWTFEVTDENLIPREFLTIDSAKVRKAIGEGTREINGIRIYEDLQIAVR